MALGNPIWHPSRRQGSLIGISQAAPCERLHKTVLQPYLPMITAAIVISGAAPNMMILLVAGYPLLSSTDSYNEQRLVLAVWCCRWSVRLKSGIHSGGILQQTSTTLSMSSDNVPSTKSGRITLKLYSYTVAKPLLRLIGKEVVCDDQATQGHDT